MVKIRRKKPKIAMVLNIAPSYRKAILTRLDNSDKVDLYFAASSEDMQISNLMDLSSLSGFKRYLKPVFSGTKLIWQHGWMSMLFGGYDGFILTANGGIRSNWLLTIAARLMGKKVYLWGHGLYGDESLKERIKLMCYMRMASGMLLYGDYGKKMLVKRGYNSKKIAVVYNSLNNTQQKLYRDRKENLGFVRNYFGSDDPNIIFLGRLTKQKKLHLLIEALGVLAAQNIACNLIVVGCGEQESELRARAEEVGVEDRIWFYGECFDESMIATLFKASKITVSPGNVGLTAMHSLSYGVPVITHNRFTKQMPEFEAVRAGVTGDFFDYDDPISLAEVIEKWLKIMSDPTEALNHNTRCKEMIDKRYNVENCATIIEKFLLKEFKL